MTSGPEWKDSGRPTVGVGIRGIHERLRHVGGRLEIESNAQGTTLTAIVPLPVHIYGDVERGAAQ